MPNQENVRRSQRVRKSVIPNDYEIYTSEVWRVIPPRMKKP
jgi:hypothetical protein